MCLGVRNWNIGLTIGNILLIIKLKIKNMVKKSLFSVKTKVLLQLKNIFLKLKQEYMQIKNANLKGKIKTKINSNKRMQICKSGIEIFKKQKTWKLNQMQQQ
jgi:hypothetical protein